MASHSNQTHCGRLVAFEGLDASGKSTQVHMVLAALASAGVAHDYLSFPRTAEPGYGEAIAMFLRGEFGSVESVHPYLVATLFAGDRLAAKQRLERSLASGAIVIVDRYVASNLAFQGAKIGAVVEKAKFREWLGYIEFECNKLPKPDRTIFLDVPFEFVRSNVFERGRESRDYLNGKADIHEVALDLQARVAEEYYALCAADPTFCRVHCSAPDGSMKDPKQIHAEVFLLIQEQVAIAAEVQPCR